MAMTIVRSSVLAPKVFSKMLLYGSSCQKFQLLHVQQACMSSSSVENIASSNKDELYRQITIEVKGHDKAILNSYEKFTSMAAKELDVYIAKIVEPPRVIARMSLMKSVFVHKKHFHQYEMRTLYKVFEIKNITGSTANTFLEYIQRNLPEGMAMKVTKHQIEKFPEHIKPPSATTTSPEVATSEQQSTAGSSKSHEVVSCSQGKQTEQGEETSTVTDGDTKISTTDVSSSPQKSKRDKKKTSQKPSEDKD